MAFGQGYDPEHPFQVIYAENVETSKGEVVKSLDPVLRSEVLTIRPGGYLIMMHHFGFPVELDGDTILRVRDFNGEFEKLAEGRTMKDFLYRNRPNFDLLFITQHAMGQMTKLQARGAVHDGPEIRIAFPPTSGAEILYKGDLCLTWNQIGTDTYEVALMDSHEEVLKRYSSTMNTVKIEVNEIRQLTPKNGKLFVRIKQEKSGKQSRAFLLREFPAEHVEFQFTCETRKAVHALVVGFCMEMSEFDFSSEAERYYRLAAELSDKGFYRTMLENFLKRK